MRALVNLNGTIVFHVCRLHNCPALTKFVKLEHDRLFKTNP